MSIEHGAVVAYALTSTICTLFFRTVRREHQHYVGKPEDTLGWAWYIAIVMGVTFPVTVPAVIVGAMVGWGR